MWATLPAWSAARLCTRSWLERLRYYLDTEFNNSGGQPLSLALTRQDGESFYAVLPVHQVLDPWVAVHVIPWLSQEPESWQSARNRLHAWLELDSGTHAFYADWPEDFEHLLHLLISAQHVRKGPRSFVCLLLDLPGFSTAEHSATPHNALADSEALMKFAEQGLQDGPGGPLTAKDLSLLAKF